MNKYEPWMTGHMRRLTWIFTGASIAGMIGATLVVLFFRWIGWGGENPTGLLFVPWLICGCLMIPYAFRRGVELERSRQDQASR